MKQLFDKISVDCSRSVTATYSTSFSLAVKMLRPNIQAPIHAIYGFVRLADEIVDTFHDYDKRTLLDELDIELNNAISRGISLNPILNAFQEVVHKYNIGMDLVNAFMASMRADLDKQTYNTKEEYESYIYGSADVVGLMCLRVFVSGDDSEYERLKQPAMKLGSAFQKVNFLRDLKDDTEMLHRSYFPELNSEGLHAETKAQIIEDIKNDFDEAYIGIKQLPIEAKFGVYTAYIYYRKLLRKLDNTRPEELASRRIRISNPIKLMLLARSFVSYKLNLI